MGFTATEISYEQICRLGDLIIGVYDEHGIELDPNSQIMRYVNSAHLLFSKWQAGDKSITQNSREFFTSNSAREKQAKLAA